MVNSTPLFCVICICVYPRQLLHPACFDLKKQGEPPASDDSFMSLPPLLDIKSGGGSMCVDSHGVVAGRAKVVCWRRQGVCRNCDARCLATVLSLPGTIVNSCLEKLDERRHCLCPRCHPCPFLGLLRNVFCSMHTSQLGFDPVHAMQECIPLR